MSNSKCSTSCPTRDHRTYGECLRSKGVRVAYANSATGLDYTEQKAWDKRIDAYKQARSEGIQPKSTRASDIKAAISHSDKTGTAYVAQ